MTPPHLCPYCGHNFEADAQVEQSGWRIDPYAGRASFRGVPVAGRVTHVRILHTIAAASGGIVTSDALLNRVSGSERRNTVQAMISQMKARWPAKVPWPIETVHNHGYRWAGG